MVLLRALMTPFVIFSWAISGWRHLAAVLPMACLTMAVSISGLSVFASFDVA